MAWPDFRAVIFDLDGLVLDSESTYFIAWRKAAETMGCRLDDDFCASLSGLHGHSVYQRLQAHCGIAFDIARFGQLSRGFWLDYVERHAIPVKAGFFHLRDLLIELNVPFALATNSRRADAAFALACAGLADAFDIMLTRDDVSQGKPAPDVFLRAAAALSQPAEACLVLEDSPVGINAAVAAGSPCIFIPSIFPADAEASAIANAVCGNLEQVADLVSASHARRL